jgi:hypothetical protein
MTKTPKGLREISLLNQPDHPFQPDEVKSVESMAHEYACAAENQRDANIRFCGFMTGFRTANVFVKGTRKQNGWIDINESQPEVDQWVIVCGVVGEVQVVTPGFRYWDELRARYAWRCADMGDYGEYMPIQRVSFWFPMPHFPNLPDMRDVPV